MRSQRTAISSILALSLLATTLAFDGSAGATARPLAQEQPPVPVPYVIGGTSGANPGYVAVLLSSAVSDPVAARFCGGSLVRVDVIMTAAHCVDDLDPDQVEVAVGFSVLSSIGAGDRLSVSDIAIHPGWVVGAVLPTDIALLELDQPLTGRPVVPLERDPVQPSKGRPLQITGWGYVDPMRAPTSLPDALQWAASTTQTSVDTSAGDAYDSCLLTDPGDDFCQGTVTTGTCQGDSGGPVLAGVSPGSPTLEVVGIVSFGPSVQCLHPDYYDGAQRISPYLGWIEPTLAGWNTPPQIAVDVGAIAGQEGALVTNSGTFDDREDLAVTISASVGTVTQDKGAHGAWTWAYTPSDGPADDQTVVISASDGAVAKTSFVLTVANVAPSVTAAPAHTVRQGAATSIVVATFSDAGVGDVHTATVDWGDGSGPRPAAVTGAGGVGQIAGMPRFATTGDQEIIVCVTDQDGAETCTKGSHRVVTNLVCPDPVLPFGDVSGSSFALGDIGCLYGLGITRGTSGVTFDPGGWVTREQMAALLARLMRAI